MIELTMKFATPEAAAAFLTGGQAPAPHFAPNVADAPAPVVNTAPVYNQAPAPVTHAPVQGHAAPAHNPAPAAAPAPAPAPAANTSGYTAAQVAQAAQAYAKVHGPKGAKAKLKELGYDKISDIRPEQYQAILTAMAV